MKLEDLNRVVIFRSTSGAGASLILDAMLSFKAQGHSGLEAELRNHRLLARPDTIYLGSLWETEDEKLLRAYFNLNFDKINQIAQRRMGLMGMAGFSLNLPTLAELISSKS